MGGCCCHYSVFRLLLLATSPPRHLANPTPMCAHPDSGCAHISVSGARAWKSAYKTLLRKCALFTTHWVPLERTYLRGARTRVCAHIASAFFLSAAAYAVR